MGVEARAKERVIEHMEKLYGGVYNKRAFYRIGCPKCRLDSDKFEFVWCPGKVPGKTEGQCTLDGQHMHLRCPRCAFTWREQTLDAGDLGDLASPITAKHPAADNGDE